MADVSADTAAVVMPGDDAPATDPPTACDWGQRRHPHVDTQADEPRHGGCKRRMERKNPATALTVRGRDRLVGVDVTERTCVEIDCDTAALVRGLCRRHYRAEQNAGCSCPIEGCGKPTVMKALGYCKAHHQRYLRGTLTPKLTQTVAEKFAQRVRVEANGCWIWTGTVDRHGYPVARFPGAMCPAHRLSYELHISPIPDGWGLDHLCHTANRESCVSGNDCLHRRCVNPEHLTPVENAENVRRGNGPSGVNFRKTHCIRGHAFDSANTRITPQGWRVCKACKNAAQSKG